MSSSSASLFPQRETRNTSDTLVTGNKCKGLWDGWKSVARFLLPAFLCAQIFWPLLTSTFYTLERRFFFREYRETFSWPIVAKKKNIKKLTIFDQNHGLAPLGKFQFFNFFSFLFSSSRKTFFRSRISWHTFSWPIFPKIKTWKNCQFFYQNHGLTPLENSTFSTFWTSCFYSVETRFFFLEYRDTHFPGLCCLA